GMWPSCGGRPGASAAPCPAQRSQRCGLRISLACTKPNASCQVHGLMVCRSMVTPPSVSLLAAMDEAHRFSAWAEDSGCTGRVAMALPAMGRGWLAGARVATRSHGRGTAPTSSSREAGTTMRAGRPLGMGDVPGACQRVQRLLDGLDIGGCAESPEDSQGLRQPRARLFRFCPERVQPAVFLEEERFVVGEPELLGDGHPLLQGIDRDVPPLLMGRQPCLVE